MKADGLNISWLVKITHMLNPAGCGCYVSYFNDSYCAFKVSSVSTKLHSLLYIFYVKITSLKVSLIIMLSF